MLALTKDRLLSNFGQQAPAKVIRELIQNCTQACRGGVGQQIHGERFVTYASPTDGDWGSMQTQTHHFG
jgi:hypothetical protein